MGEKKEKTFLGMKIFVIIGIIAICCIIIVQLFFAFARYAISNLLAGRIYYY